MEKTFPNDYYDKVVNVLKAMSLSDGKKLKVIGSASMRAILYSGDYDANETLSGSPESVAKGLQGVIRRLKALPGVIIGDIKCGGTLEEPRRWTPAQILGGEGLSEAVAEKGLRKVDAVANINGRYVELSTVYLFPSEELGVKEFVRELQAVTREKLREGDYWKALKRYFSIQRLKDTNKVEPMLEVFNGDLGILYSVISDIEVLEYLLEKHKGDKKAIAQEISDFKARLGHIWTLKDFLKKEPRFDKELTLASKRPALLSRIKENFRSILQAHAKPLVKKWVGDLHGGSGVREDWGEVYPGVDWVEYDMEDEELASHASSVAHYHELVQRRDALAEAEYNRRSEHYGRSKSHGGRLVSL